MRVKRGRDLLDSLAFRWIGAHIACFASAGLVVIWVIFARGDELRHGQQQGLQLLHAVLYGGQLAAAQVLALWGQGFRAPLARWGLATFLGGFAAPYAFLWFMGVYIRALMPLSNAWPPFNAVFGYLMVIGCILSAGAALALAQALVLLRRVPARSAGLWAVAVVAASSAAELAVYLPGWIAGPPYPFGSVTVESTLKSYSVNVMQGAIFSIALLPFLRRFLDRPPA